MWPLWLMWLVWLMWPMWPMWHGGLGLFVNVLGSRMLGSRGALGGGELGASE